MVQTGVGNLRSGGNPAKAGPAGQPIDTALAWTALALCQLIRESLLHNEADHSTTRRICRVRVQSGKSLPPACTPGMMDGVEKNSR